MKANKNQKYKEAFSQNEIIQFQFISIFYWFYCFHPESFILFLMRISWTLERRQVKFEKLFQVKHV